MDIDQYISSNIDPCNMADESKICLSVGQNLLNSRIFLFLGDVSDNVT